MYCCHSSYYKNLTPIVYIRLFVFLVFVFVTTKTKVLRKMVTTSHDVREISSTKSQFKNQTFIFPQ